MGLKADAWIRKMALEHGMIEPFTETQVRSGVISYGLSSYGYDVRIADEFKIFTNINSTIVDPKKFLAAVPDLNQKPSRLAWTTGASWTIAARTSCSSSLALSAIRIF